LLKIYFCFIVPSGEWEKNPRLQAKTSVCPDGVKKRNIHRLKAVVLNDLVNYSHMKAAVFRGGTLQASAGGG
jgi:hypothetical protein